VSVPSYDRTALTPSVVHLSVGSFHRSHQAVYFDELARQGHTGWGLTGVGLRRREMRDALVPQDCLYTVVERGPGGDRARVVGVIGRYLFAPDAPSAVVGALADPRTRLVTLTVTGAAYDVRAPDVLEDLAHPGRPRSALGFLVAGLDRRRRGALGPLTILSCDNMPASGDVARDAITAFARLRDEGLAQWIEEHVTFPSSMVDRITPRTTDADRERLARELGVEDRWPVMTEPYADWVIEDDFAAGRPPLEEAGVRCVADVRPYALIKTRLLNATHCALGHLGVLAGLRATDEAMADPLFAEYVARLTAEEIAPLLPRVPGLDLVAYRRSALERLSNPCVVDQLERLCRGGSLKLPRHVLPSIAARRAAGAPHALLTLAVAGFCAQVRGPHALDDPAADRLRALAPDVRALVAELGPVGADPAFAREVEQVVAHIERDGVRAALAAALGAAEPMAA
jgi:fructuronate reductase/mannitol 2-dehydrogenase